MALMNLTMEDTEEHRGNVLGQGEEHFFQGQIRVPSTEWHLMIV